MHPMVQPWKPNQGSNLRLSVSSIASVELTEENEDGASSGRKKREPDQMCWGMLRQVSSWPASVGCKIVLARTAIMRWDQGVNQCKPRKNLPCCVDRRVKVDACPLSATIQTGRSALHFDWTHCGWATRGWGQKAIIGTNSQDSVATLKSKNHSFKYFSIDSDSLWNQDAQSSLCCYIKVDWVADWPTDRLAEWVSEWRNGWMKERTNKPTKEGRTEVCSNKNLIRQP